MTRSEIIHISDNEVLRFLSAEDCIQSVKVGLIANKSKNVISPQRTVCVQPHGLFLDMPSGILSSGLYGTKLSLLQPDMPFPNGNIYKTSIFAMENKGPYRTFVIDAMELTHLRTASVVTVASELLIKKGTSEISVIGAGTQAEYIVEFLCQIFPILKVYVFNYKNAKVKNWISQMNKKLGPSVELRAVDLSSCLSISTVIMATSTAKTDPIVKQFGLESGQTILSIGGSAKGACEFASDLLYEASVVVDNNEGVWAEAGEFESADRSRITLCSLDSLVAGNEWHDTLVKDKNTIFKSVGLGYLDLFIAQSVIKKMEDKDA